MRTIQIKDKRFRLSITETEIQRRVKSVAARLSQDYRGRQPLFLAVLNGSFVFAADLLREVDTSCQVSFVRLSSYEGADTTGRVLEVLGLAEDIGGRDVVVVEDIVDTGLTMAHLLSALRARRPASLEVCALLVKPGKLRVSLDIRYRCLEIPDDFIVGYGLDYDGLGRNTRDIYTLAPDADAGGEDGPQQHIITK